VTLAAAKKELAEKENVAAQNGDADIRGKEETPVTFMILGIELEASQ
jgi:hypothetical protein